MLVFFAEFLDAPFELRGACFAEAGFVVAVCFFDAAEGAAGPFACALFVVYVLVKVSPSSFGWRKSVVYLGLSLLTSCACD